MWLVTAALRSRRGWLREMVADAFGPRALDDALTVYPDAPVSDLPGLDGHQGPGRFPDVSSRPMSRTATRPARTRPWPTGTHRYLLFRTGP